MVRSRASAAGVRVLAPAAAVAVLAAACAGGGTTGTSPSPSAAPPASSAGVDADALLATGPALPGGVLLAAGDLLGSATVATLAGVDAESTAALATAATAGVDVIGARLDDRTPATGGPAGLARRPTVAGVDERVVGFQQDLAQQRSVATGTLTDAGSVELALQDRTVDYHLDLERIVTSGSGERVTDRQAREVVVPVCPDDEGRIEGTWTQRRTITTERDGASRTVEIDVQGEVAISTTSEAGRGTSATIGPATIQVRAGGSEADVMTIQLEPLSVPTTDAVGAMDAVTAGVRGVVTTRSTELRAEADRLAPAVVADAAAAALASLAAAARAADEGLCVVLEVGTNGVTTLAPGASATVTARVVDARTRAPIDGAVVEATPVEGGVEPPRAPSPATFTYTAPGGAPPYTLYLDVDTPRGGDDAEVVFQGGWAFQDVVLTATDPFGQGSSSVWSGVSCGDPLVDPWRFTVVTTRSGGSTDVADFTMPLIPAGDPLPPFGTRPVVTPVEAPAPGAPPFELVLDTVNAPGITPPSAVVPVDLVPATVAC